MTTGFFIKHISYKIYFFQEGKNHNNLHSATKKQMKRFLENYFQQLGLKILKRDYSSQEFNIEGVDEKIILIQYLLEKNGK